VPISVASKQLIGGSQQVITNDDGSYGFVNLPPGVYELVIAMEGFAPIKQVGIRVNAGQRSSVDIELEVGGAMSDSRRPRSSRRSTRSSTPRARRR
jgi:hypothetical protein